LRARAEDIVDPSRYAACGPLLDEHAHAIAYARSFSAGTSIGFIACSVSASATASAVGVVAAPVAWL